MRIGFVKRTCSVAIRHARDVLGHGAQVTAVALDLVHHLLTLNDALG